MSYSLLTNHQSPITDYRLPITDYRLPNTELSPRAGVSSTKFRNLQSEIRISSIVIRAKPVEDNLLPFGSGNL
jgi:hypothetical protein